MATRRARNAESRLVQAALRAIRLLSGDPKVGRATALEVIQQIAHDTRHKPQVVWKHAEDVLRQLKTQIQPVTREAFTELRSAALEHNSEHLGALSRAPGRPVSQPFARGRSVRVVVGRSMGLSGVVVTSGYAQTRFRDAAGRMHDIGTRFLEAL